MKNTILDAVKEMHLRVVGGQADARLARRLLEVAELEYGATSECLPLIEEMRVRVAEMSATSTQVEAQGPKSLASWQPPEQGVAPKHVRRRKPRRQPTEPMKLRATALAEVHKQANLAKWALTREECVACYDKAMAAERRHRDGSSARKQQEERYEMADAIRTILVMIGKWNERLRLGLPAQSSSLNEEHKGSNEVAGPTSVVPPGA